MPEPVPWRDGGPGAYVLPPISGGGTPVVGKCGYEVRPRCTPTDPNLHMELHLSQIGQGGSTLRTQPVIPLRVYDDMEAAQHFLVDVLGFKRGRLDRDPSGRPVHAEVSTGDSVIWLHRVDPEHGLASARSL